jgi:hypothetical protein
MLAHIQHHGLVIVHEGGVPPWTIRPVEGGLEIQAPSRATGQKAATRFLRSELFDQVVLLVVGFNSRVPARVTGPAVVWSYADGHGMKLYAILRRSSTAELWTPGHHGHGPGTTRHLIVHADGMVTASLRPSALEVKL